MVRRCFIGLLGLLAMVGAAVAQETADDDALARWQQRYVAALAAGQPGQAVEPLIEISQHYAGQERPVAIFYAKQALELLQRNGPQNAGGDQPRTTKLYHTLASELLDARRLAEAGHILDIQKQQEYFDFIGRDGATPTQIIHVSYSKNEQPWAERWRQMAAELTTVANRGEAGAAVRHEALALLAQSDHALAEAPPQTTQFVGRNLTPAPDQDENQPRAARLRYLLLEDRLRILVQTEAGEWLRDVPLDVSELRRQVTLFRQAVTRPALDPRPSGEALYQWLIRPLEQGLAAARVDVLIFSLPGELRYLPMAALYDGRRYLAEKYGCVLDSAAVMVEQRDRDTPVEWRIAGLGVTRASVIVDPVTRAIDRFSALPAVKRELTSVVRIEGGDGGLLPGEIELDDQFTAARLQQMATQYPVLHIASHFRLRPEDAARSYLVLGNEEALTLRQMRQQGFDLSQVKLLTLSACETVIDGQASDGREIEGLGALARSQGAGSVIATLWSVNDESTAIFMQSLYTALSQPGTGRAEALRHAQRQMLTGTFQPASAAPQRMAERERPSAAPTAIPRFPLSTTASYAHPYYWAPFLLMGEWR